MAHPAGCGGGRESPNWKDVRNQYRNGNGEPLYVNVRTIDFSGVTNTGWDQYGNKSYTFSGEDYTVYGTVTLHQINDQEFQVLPDPHNNNIRWNEGLTFRNLATAANRVVYGSGKPYGINFVGIRQFDKLGRQQ